MEPTQVARTQQAFTMWGRPTTLENGCFLLKQMYREAVKLSTEGLTPLEFDVTHAHLVGQIPLLAKSLDRQIGYALDSVFYGMSGNYLTNLQEKVAALSADAVKSAIQKYIQPQNFSVVVVTKDADKFKAELASGNCPITYQEGIQKPTEILEEDKAIATYSIPASRMDVVTAESIYR